MSTVVVADVCGIADELGPEQVVLLRETTSGVESFVVVDNVSCGPAIGGVRMQPDVTVSEVARLARAMTLKNAAAHLRHGGAKAGIAADPLMPADQKEELVRWFARAIVDITSYVPGPDMGTDERCMAWVHDEIGRSVGLPSSLGGIPLDELGATGYGVAVAADAAADAGLVGLRGARVAIQGFGAVGTHAARFLAERGASIVAVSNSAGAVVDQSGLPVEPLIAWSAEGRELAAFPGGEPLERDALIAVDCEILVPAARPDVITAANVHDVKARLVLEGANIPITLDAEATLHERGIVCLPDFIVNAGGVICAAVEYEGGTRTQAFAQITETIRTNTAEVIERARTLDTLPRTAADALARGRVLEAMSFRRRCC